MNDFEKTLEGLFGGERLARIRDVKVGIAGLGGLGSNCAANLVRSGFRRFVLCDFDTVELSNLNRQFYFLDQVGLPKTEALKTSLLRINPDLELELHAVRVTRENVRGLFADSDAVIEAFDGADCKSMIAEAFARSGKFFVAASGIAGCGDSDAIAVRKVHDGFHLVGDLVSEVTRERPPCSPRVTIAAAKEADTVLAWVWNDDQQER